VTNLEPVQLLQGSYVPPKLHRGDRSVWLYRDCDVVVTGWTDARISWPRCRAYYHRRGGPGLLVTEDLARAIRTEAALALCYWFGVGDTLVWKWRQAFGVEKLNKGSAWLRQALNQELRENLRGIPLPADQVERRRRTTLERNLGQYLQLGFQGPWWTTEEDDLVKRLSPAEAARQTGRTLVAVSKRRRVLGLP
jgi:hypothetical protein